jgi:DNA-binding response OmpR family regulator
MFKASPPSPTEHVGESATVGAPSSNVSLDFAGSYVLIVEDDPALSLDLVSSLTGAGATPLGPVTNLEEAEQIIEAIHCDAIILDLRVGNRNATSFAKLLLFKRIPFLIYTGYPDNAYLNLDWPGCGILWKPAEMGSVLAILAGLIAWSCSEQCGGGGRRQLA